jgi:hypothetical protein
VFDWGEPASAASRTMCMNGMAVTSLGFVL